MQREVWPPSPVMVAFLCYLKKVTERNLAQVNFNVPPNWHKFVFLFAIWRKYVVAHSMLKSN
jgi:hypothetical protein